MTGNFGAAFVSNYVNGYALIDTRKGNFKHIGVTKSGLLALLLKEIEIIRTEAIFVNHNVYCIFKILNTLRIWSMGQEWK